MDSLIGEISKELWSKIRLGTQEMELAEIEYTPFQGKKSYRLVVSRIKRSDNQMDAFSKSSLLDLSLSLTNGVEPQDKRS